MLASPPALLSLCLRSNDFQECKNIIQFFGLESAEAKEVWPAFVALKRKEKLTPQILLGCPS